MKLFKIWQTVNNDYDTYSDAVVCAKSSLDAATIDPCEYRKEPVTNDRPEFDSWCALADVQVEYIGDAASGLKRGVICASFHAG